MPRTVHALIWALAVPSLGLLCVPVSAAAVQEIDRDALQERIPAVPAAAGVIPQQTDLPPDIKSSLSPFRADPDSSRVAILLSRWTESGYPRSDYDRVIAARLWRRAGETDLAMEALRQVPVSLSPHAALVELERARILFESGLRPHAAKATASFWRACDGMGEAVKQELWQDLIPLSTPEERERWEEWAALPAGPESCAWVRDFIEERAYRMTVSAEERLRIHYLRLAEARRLYWIRKPRRYQGMSDLRGRPATVWMDDRGLLFVRMGEPDHAEACPRFEEPRDAFGVCWAYERPAGYKLYFLSTLRRTEQGELELAPADGDFRIQETLGPRARPGDLYFQKYVVNADIPRSVRAHLTRSAALSRGALSRSRTESHLNAAEARAYGRLIQLATSRHTSEALEAVPDVPIVTSDARMLWEALRFLNPLEGRWQVWIVASLRAADLKPGDQLGDNRPTYGIRARLATMTSGGMTLDSATSHTLPAADVDEAAGLPIRMAVAAKPGALPFSLAITDAHNQGHGAWVQDTVRLPEIGALPQLSDIAVAQRAGGGWTRDGETFLQVTPAHITDERGTLHIYFEVYGIPVGTDYEIEVRITREKRAKDVFEQPAAGLPFRLGFTQTMPAGAIGRHPLRLDLGRTDAGAYSLVVRARDTVSGNTSLPTITTVYVRKRVR